MSEQPQLSPPDEWLEKINAELSAKEVPHVQRPMEAWREWSMETGVSLALNDPDVKRIFEWVAENAPEGAHNLGSMYVGSYYFDASFWPVTIWPIFGTVRIDGRNALTTMPDPIRQRLFSGGQMQDYISVWMDCVDYGLGFDDTVSSSSTDFSLELLRSADQQLRSTVTVLHQRHPNPKALESARMATEMFLKSFLAHHGGLTEDDARKRIGHDLTKALNEALSLDPSSEIGNIAQHLNVFPFVGDRYKGSDYRLQDLWLGYQIAQFTGTFVVRSLSGRDIRKQPP